MPVCNNSRVCKTNTHDMRIAFSQKRKPCHQTSQLKIIGLAHVHFSLEERYSHAANTFIAFVAVAIELGQHVSDHFIFCIFLSAYTYAELRGYVFCT